MSKSEDKISNIIIFACLAAIVGICAGLGYGSATYEDRTMKSCLADGLKVYQCEVLLHTRCWPTNVPVPTKGH
jgi:hypothetical protein